MNAIHLYVCSCHVHFKSFKFIVSSFSFFYLSVWLKCFLFKIKSYHCCGDHSFGNCQICIASLLKWNYIWLNKLCIVWFTFENHLDNLSSDADVDGSSESVYSGWELFSSNTIIILYWQKGTAVAYVLQKMELWAELNCLHLCLSFLAE